MDDTSPEMIEKMDEMIRMKSPIERLKMGCSMFDTAKRLVIAGIMHENPTISKVELRREIFLRFYGEDFDEVMREKILKHLDGLGS
jgi:hypothetical protein